MSLSQTDVPSKAPSPEPIKPPSSVPTKPPSPSLMPLPSNSQPSSSSSALPSSPQPSSTSPSNVSPSNPSYDISSCSPLKRIYSDPSTSSASSQSSISSSEDLLSPSRIAIKKLTIKERMKMTGLDFNNAKPIVPQGVNKGEISRKDRVL